MRENRLYGSEGGEVKSLPYPYQGSVAGPSLFSSALSGGGRMQRRRGLHDRRYQYVEGNCSSRGGLLRCARNDGERQLQL